MMDDTKRRDIVKAWLERHDRAQAWLSRRAGYSDGYLRAVLNGHMPFSYELIQALEQETGMQLTEHH